jgi:hypothetical protein
MMQRRQARCEEVASTEYQFHTSALIVDYDQANSRISEEVTLPAPTDASASPAP